MFSLVLKQTLNHSFRRGGGAFGVLAFYLMVITAFTFALTPEGLKEYALAVQCVALLMAITTALPLLFEQDYEDGTLEQFLLQPTALEWLVAAKLAGLAIALAGPVLLLTPLIAAIAGLTASETANAFMHLLLLAPVLLALGAVAVALTLGHRRGGLLQALITLPFAMPAIIFAASKSGEGAISFLAGMTLISVPLACLICASLIRISQE